MFPPSSTSSSTMSSPTTRTTPTLTSNQILPTFCKKNAFVYANLMCNTQMHVHKYFKKLINTSIEMFYAPVNPLECMVIGAQ